MEMLYIEKEKVADMLNLLNNLLDRDNPAKKLQKEIDNTEFKKQSLISPLQTEISTAQKKINEALLKIGSAVYDRHENCMPTDETSLQKLYDEISTHKRNLSEKEAKIKEFTTRYEEEIDILKASLASMLAEPAPPVPSKSTSGDSPKAYCTNCGSLYSPEDDQFCTGCGRKIE